jgi:hypothetical protein
MLIYAVIINYNPMYPPFLQALTGSQTKCLKYMTKVARHVSPEEGKITFDQIGVLALRQKLPGIL